MEKTERISGDLEFLKPYLDEYAVKTHELIKAMGKSIKAKFDALAKELPGAIQYLTGDIKKVEVRADFTEHKMGKINNLFEADLEERAILESQIKEFQLRFRTIPEQSGGD